MTAIEMLNQAAKISQEVEKAFPTYIQWFNSEVNAGRLTDGQFTLMHPAYREAKMTAVKRAINEAFNS